MALCEACDVSEAVTRDGKLCRKCLNRWLDKQAQTDVRSLYQTPRGQQEDPRTGLWSYGEQTDDEDLGDCDGDSGSPDSWRLTTY